MVKRLLLAATLLAATLLATLSAATVAGPHQLVAGGHNPPVELPIRS